MVVLSAADEVCCVPAAAVAVLQSCQLLLTFPPWPLAVQQQLHMQMDQQGSSSSSSCSSSSSSCSSSSSKQQLQQEQQQLQQQHTSLGNRLGSPLVRQRASTQAASNDTESIQESRRWCGADQLLQ